MGQWVLILLLPLAAWSGWWVGMRKEARDLRKSKARTAYFEGISYLLNDETDRAVDVFISIADLDQQTIDNQLTLGRLFRKRGELDRALHMHQQLSKYDKLTVAQRAAIHYELALDYDQAGMLAQAQALLETLLDDNYQPRAVIKALGRIYERTGQWQSVIELAERWQQSGYGQLGHDIAHYHCELAQLAMADKDFEQALALLDTALQQDRDCARANMMRGELYIDSGHYVGAIHALQSVGTQQATLLPEVLPKLAVAYGAIEREEEYGAWLLDIEAQQQMARLTLATAQTLVALGKQAQAQELLKTRMLEKPNPLLLSNYLDNCRCEDDAALTPHLSNSIAPQTVYQCNECGFRQQRLIWHCPACYAWGSFMPVIELKIEQR